MFCYHIDILPCAFDADFYCIVWLAFALVQVTLSDYQVLGKPLQDSFQPLHGLQSPHLPSPARKVFKMNFRMMKTISFISSPPL